MARFARVVAAGVPHHLTQRGNARRIIFNSDADRLVYLNLLEADSRLHGLAVLGFCLMSNHVHLVVLPNRAESMALALRHAHGRYASYLNAKEGGSGHVWQGRYYSCPLDPDHLCRARPNIAAVREIFRHSRWTTIYGARWTPARWREYLGQDEAGADAEPLRASTHTGRPLGDSELVRNLEGLLRRRLAPQKRGRRPKAMMDSTQEAFVF
jgi:putative transposase